MLNFIQISEVEKINFYRTYINFNKQYNYFICRLFYRGRTIKRKNQEDELRKIQKNILIFYPNQKYKKL